MKLHGGRAQVVFVIFIFNFFHLINFPARRTWTPAPPRNPAPPLPRIVRGHPRVNDILLAFLLGAHSLSSPARPQLLSSLHPPLSAPPHQLPKPFTPPAPRNPPRLSRCRTIPAPCSARTSPPRAISHPGPQPPDTGGGKKRWRGVLRLTLWRTQLAPTRSCILRAYQGLRGQCMDCVVPSVVHAGVFSFLTS